MAPPACFPSLCCRGRGVGVSSPSRLTELPRRSHCGQLLSGAAATPWIAYIDWNEIGSSPTPTQTGTSRAQQSPTTYSHNSYVQRKCWHWLHGQCAWIPFENHSQDDLKWTADPKFSYGETQNAAFLWTILPQLRNEDGDDSGAPRSNHWRIELQDRTFGAATACALL